MKLILFILSLFLTDYLLAAEHQILVHENRFDPEVVTIETGDIVKWTVIAVPQP